MLQGSGFDHNQNKLSDPDDSSPEYINLPEVYLAWVPMTDDEPYNENEIVVI